MAGKRLIALQFPYVVRIGPRRFPLSQDDKYKNEKKKNQKTEHVKKAKVTKVEHLPVSAAQLRGNIDCNRSRASTYEYELSKN